ncbi:MAG: T9SS type A sorting domain-containing protein [Salibacteraceae bacterium]
MKKQTGMKTISTILFFFFTSQLFCQAHWSKISNQSLYCLVQTTAGDFWAGTDSGVVNTNFNTLNTHYANTFLSGNNNYKKIVIDGLNKLYLLTNNRQLYSFNTNTLTWGFEFSSVKQIESDDSGNIWVLLYGGNPIKLKKTGESSFKDFKWQLPFSTNQYLFKSKKGVITCNYIINEFHVLDSTGLISTILIDTNKTNGQLIMDNNGFIAEQNLGEFVIYPSQTVSSQSVEFNLISINSNTNQYKLDPFYNYSSNSNNQWGQAQYCHSNGNELIFHIQEANFNPGHEEPDNYFISDNGGFKFGDHRSGLGTASVRNVYSSNGTLYVVSKLGVYMTSLSNIPTNPNTHLDPYHFGGYFSPTGSMFGNQLHPDNEIVSGSSSSVQFNRKGNLIFHAVPWFAAKNKSNNNLHVSAQMFERGDEDARFYNGPISSNYDDYSIPWIQRVNSSEIDAHKRDYAKPHYKMPESIQNWPAHGFQKYGQALCLAPFEDVNGDGYYSPSLGDYPKIRGDEAVYCIYNDDKIKRDSTFKNLGIEIHAMYYRFNNTSDVKALQSVFIHYEIINRSNNNYDSLKIGLFNDFDIGCSQDDYIGCNPKGNTFFAYNGDSYDEDCIGMKGFGSKPPVMMVTTLSDSLAGFSFFSSGSGSFPLATPFSDTEFNHYLNGRLNDGSQMVHGGQGYKISGSSDTIPTKFMFPGNYNGLPEWTDKTAGNTPGDRRGVGTIGPFELNSQEVKTFDIMYHVGYDPIIGYDLQNIGRDVELLKTFHSNQNYSNNTYICSGVPIDLSKDESFNTNELVVVYPNPSTGKLNLKVTKDELFHIRLTSIDGKQVLNKNIRLLEGDNPFDFSHLNSGTYMLNLESDQVETSKKLIIQH